MKTILAPIDFSPVTQAVAAEAIRLARLLKARVRFVHVVEPPSGVRDLFPAGQLSAEVLLVAKQAAQTRLEGLKQKLQARYPKCEFVRLTGTRVKCVIEEAKKLRVAYIVIGSHGHGAVFDALVGSVARGVLQQAPCPVVVVSSPRAATG